MSDLCSLCSSMVCNHTPEEKMLGESLMTPQGQRELRAAEKKIHRREKQKNGAVPSDVKVTEGNRVSPRAVHAAAHPRR